MPRVEPRISRDKLFELLEYEPHSQEQKDVHNCESRFRVACCGRRWGKSTWAGHELTYKMFVPDSINWIVAPEYQLGEKEFRVVYNDFKKLGILGKCQSKYNVEHGRMYIYVPEVNSLLMVKSATRPDSLVGEGLDHVCMSEAAKHSASTWEMYIRPALMDKRGSADFPSTPQGYNWYKGIYDVGQDEEFNEYSSFRLPSWTNTVLFPGGYDDPEIQAIKDKVSEVYFDQEIGAKFTAFVGMIYPEFNPDVHVKTFDWNPAWANWLALDFGYVDPFVCLDVSIDATQRVWVWREYMESYKSTHQHGIILRDRENPPGYHIDSIAADPKGADEIATLTWVLGSINNHSLGWDLGIEEIKRALKVRDDGLPGLIIHPRCKNLIRQMQQLRAKAPREGHNAQKGQHDHDDHGPDALRYFFNEFFVLGARFSLRDMYNVPQARTGRTEADSMFTYETNIALGEKAISLGLTSYGS